MDAEWTLLQRLILVKVTILTAGSGEPTSDLVGIGRVDYMELLT